VGSDLVERLEAPEARGVSRERPALSVVIPTYNGRRLLEVCLSSLERCRPPDLAMEMIVADDASTDGTAEWVASAYPRVRVVRRSSNGGFVAAANAGIAAARGAVIQLLNNDTEVTPGWAEAGLAPFDDPGVGSVAPLVLVRSEPGRVDSAGDGYALVGWPFKRGHGEPAAKWAAHPPDRVLGASGSSAFYRASALATVGGYDPAFGSYYEDIDLAFRLRWAGYSCVFAPACRVLHEVSASYDHARPDLQRRMARNAELLYWSDLPLGFIALSFWPHVAFTAAQAAWRLARGRLRPFLAGKLDALRMLPVFRSRRANRLRLRRSAIRPPHFPVSLAPLASVRNHLTRPRS
jgi:GT2 family glycosyltransferase